MRAPTNLQDSSSTMPMANVVELWGDGPLFPGPGWLLFWPMPEQKQQQIRASIANGWLWETAQSLIPALAEIKNPWPLDEKVQSQAVLDAFILQAVIALGRALFQPAKLELCTPWTDFKGQPSCLLVRSTQHELAGKTLSSAASLIRTVHRQEYENPPEREVQRIREVLTDLLQQISICCGHELTMAQLDQAERRNIPIALIDPNQRLYQLGSGHYSRLICSTSNDRDSAFGVAIACNKSKTHDVLRQLGLPVPREMRLSYSISNEHLLAAAERLGYPCVLKPQDGEQGRGVTAHIMDPEELLAAARKARDRTQTTLLLQQHVEGEDYRLNTINGRIVFVVKRSAPRVTGNGKDSVLELIRQENQKRVRLRQQGAITVDINPEDQEILDRITKAGLQLNSVVTKGRSIQLRSTANISTGGMREEIDPASVHPVIHKQCETIARSLRLDNCGIDYIGTSILLPPTAANGHYIEINNMPQNSRSRASLLLNNLYPDNQLHSISTAVIIGDWNSTQPDEINKLLDSLLMSHPKATVGLPKDLHRQALPLLASHHQQLVHTYNHPREILLDHSIGYAVHLTSPMLAARRGLPLSIESKIICLNSCLKLLHPSAAWQKLHERHKIIPAEGILNRRQPAA